MKEKKIHVVYGSSSDVSWINNAIAVSNIDGADALLLTGGGDIHESYYGCLDGGNECHTENEPSKRDIIENYAISYALKNKIPLIGICRGFQWICIKAGGKLVQHVVGHSHNSGINVDGKIYKANSIHHQMVYPWGLKEHNMSFGLNDEDYQIIGKIDKPTSTGYYINGELYESIPAEIEIAYFKKVNGFGVQFHPEMMYHSEYYKETLDLLNKLLHETIWKENLTK
jgi:gamma-glutamyl-gamma-aminobutyrate hydrolase PuuD